MTADEVRKLIENFRKVAYPGSMMSDVMSAFVDVVEATVKYIEERMSAPES